MEIVIRELKRRDLTPWVVASVMRTLKNLGDTSLGGLTPHRAQGILLNLIENPAYHLVAVIRSDSGAVVGLATLLVEQKLIHNGGRVGRIEDVVVHKDYIGQRIGTELVHYMVACAQHQGCYKIVLQCDEGLIPFYERFGFYSDGVTMRANLPKAHYRGARR